MREDIDIVLHVLPIDFKHLKWYHSMASRPDVGSPKSQKRREQGSLTNNEEFFLARVKVFTPKYSFSQMDSPEGSGNFPY